MLITDVPDAPEIAGHGRHRTGRSTNDRFRDECGNVLRTQFANFLVELVGNPAPVVFGRFVIAPVTVFEARRDVVSRHHQ